MITKHWQLSALLAVSLLTGIALRYILPAGFAAHVVANPWLLINVLLLYPLAEELLFRGAIQGALLEAGFVKRNSLPLRQRPKKLLSRFSRRLQHVGISSANIISSLLFVSLHLLNHSLVWALAVLIPSLALGYMRERYGNIIVPILLHVFFNAIYLIAGV